jgi:hypothetical protein
MSTIWFKIAQGLDLNQHKPFSWCDLFYLLKQGVCLLTNIAKSSLLSRASTFRHLAICLSFQAVNLSSDAIGWKEMFN